VKWLKTLAAVFGGAAAALAAAAAVVDNSKTVGGFVAEWLYPLVETEATFVVGLDPEAPRELNVAVADKATPNRAVDQLALAPGGSVTFQVPIKAFYVISWEGNGYKAAAIDDIQAPAKTRRWTLSLSDNTDDGIVLKPDEEGTNSKIETVAAPAATLIAGASAADKTGGSAPMAGSQLVPELYRALATVGLFEVGTTDCMAFSYVNDFDLGVGCLAASVRGPLGGLFKAIDERQPALLDQFLGEDAAFIRRLVETGGQPSTYQELKGQKERQKHLREGLGALARTLDFRSEYQLFAERYYARALQRAKELNLRSERGVLFVFDREVQQGPGWLRKIAAEYGQQEKSIAAGDDRKRLELLSRLLKSTLPQSFVQHATGRMDTIISGQGTLRGIAFDLDSIGIRYDSIVVVDTTGVTIHPADATASAPDTASPAVKWQSDVYLVLFAAGSDAVDDGGMAAVAQVAQDAGSRQGAKISLIGHTDSQGDEASNLDLSRRMAEGVKAALIAHGFDGGRITVEFKGKSEPVIPVPDGTTDQANRRVEIILSWPS